MSPAAFSAPLVAPGVSLFQLCSVLEGVAHFFAQLAVGVVDGIKGDGLQLC